MSNNNSYTSGIISDENRYGYGQEVESRSQQQNRERELRSAAKRRAYEQDARDVADAVVADAVADAESEAIEPQYHWCSGELFDLTVTSYNNIYGKEKILYSMMYGISSPIQKYLDELYKIEKENIQKQRNGETPGDKDAKRALRQEFLELCNDNDDLKLYFRQMCNYLNGKTGDIVDQYEQPLTIVCAGGNLITIFFKLLLNIISTNLDSLNVNPNFTILVGKITTYFATNPDIVQFIKTYEREDTFILFSDFDYNLVPYLVDRRIFNRGQDPLKKQLNNQEQQGVEELLHNTFFGNTETTMGDMDGFILFRVKTRFKSVMDSIYRGLKYTDQEQFKEFKKACNENRDNNGKPAPLTNLYAQIVKDSEISKINSGNQLCKTYYNYLLKKKKYIKDATNLNVRKTIEYWKTNVIHGSSDLNAIIEYLHAVTTNLNKEIAYRQPQGTQYFDLFKSLNTMLVDDTLVEESSNILIDFMVQGNVNDPNYLHTNEIIESIHADENERTAVCGVPAKEGNELIHANPFIRAVPQPDFGDLMETIKIQPSYFRELGPVIPNDISIILNVIQTDEIDDPDVANDSPDISPIIRMSFGGKKTKKNKKNNKKKSRTNKKKSRINKKKSRTNKKKSRKK